MVSTKMRKMDLELTEAYTDAWARAAEPSKPWLFNPDWVSGFFDGEGSISLEFPLRARISFAQGNLELLEKLKEYLGFGHIYKRKARDVGKYKCNPVYEFVCFEFFTVKFMVNFFKRHPLHTVKMDKINLINEWMDNRDMPPADRRALFLRWQKFPTKRREYTMNNDGTFNKTKLPY